MHILWNFTLTNRWLGMFTRKQGSCYGNYLATSSKPRPSKQQTCLRCYTRTAPSNTWMITWPSAWKPGHVSLKMRWTMTQSGISIGWYLTYIDLIITYTWDFLYFLLNCAVENDLITLAKICYLSIANSNFACSHVKDVYGAITSKLLKKFPFGDQLFEDTVLSKSEDERTSWWV